MKIADLTPEWLIKEFFFGIYKTDPLTGDVYLADPNDANSRLPESVLQHSIDASIDRLEGTIGASIRIREQIEEFHDYDADLQQRYSFVKLRRYPLITLHSMSFVYGDQGQTIWTVPGEIVQKKIGTFGIIQLLPFRTLAAGVYDTALVPFISGSLSANYAPNIIKMVYDAGMTGELDWDIVRAIGLMAAVQPLNILGDILIGAGIASISTSFDGISQSVNTTASAENSAFSARILQHNNELLGHREGQAGLIDALKAKWRRIPLGLL